MLIESVLVCVKGDRVYVVHCLHHVNGIDKARVPGAQYSTCPPRSLPSAGRPQTRWCFKSAIETAEEWKSNIQDLYRLAGGGDKQQLARQHVDELMMFRQQGVCADSVPAMNGITCTCASTATAKDTRLTTSVCESAIAFGGFEISYSAFSFKMGRISIRL